MQVMRESEQRRPRLRRLGDQLGAVYTPLAVADRPGRLGVERRAAAVPGRAGGRDAVPAADRHPGGDHRLRSRWRPDAASSSRTRPCWRQIDTCRTAIFDKTGTLTYGRPRLTEVLPAAGSHARRGARRWSPAWNATRGTRWPRAVLAGGPDAGAAACRTPARSASGPARGCAAIVGGQRIAGHQPRRSSRAEPRPAPMRSRRWRAGWSASCLIDGRYAATFRFRDEPRAEGRSFVAPPGPAAPLRPRDAGLRRPRERRCATWPSRSASRGARRPEPRAEAGDRPRGDARGRRPSSSATASTTRRR